MSIKRMLIIIACLILLVACSTDSVQKPDYEKLEEMRSQPTDVQVNERTEFMDEQGFDTDIVPASAWMEWNIYQPTRYYLIDFSDNNGHQDLDSKINEENTH